MNDATDSAKKLKNYMMGFDELNVISPNTGETESSAGEFEFELPEYDFLGGLVDSKVSGIVEDMKEWLGITEDIKSWSDLLSTNFGNILASIGLIGVGMVAWKIGSIVTDAKKLEKAITTIKKAIQLTGIALKAMGAAAVIAAATAGAIWLFQNTEDTITKIGAVVSAASLAVGAILAFTGINLPLGIALMAVGAVSMGTAIALNTNKLSDDVKNIIGVIGATVAGALLVVGSILAFTGANIPLGLALIGGGAVTMGTAIAPNWNSFSDEVQTVITTIMGIVGGAGLALGAMLAFTGANIPLGIGLMAVGALSVGAALALNWDSMGEGVGSVVTTLTEIVGGALLAVGAVLAFTGANLPLGIGLIAVGAITLASAIALNTSALSDEVKGVIAIITAAVSVALLAVGAILAFTGANIPLGIALMAGGALALGAAIAPNWGALSESVQTTISSILAIAGASLLGIGMILAFTGAATPLGIGLMVVGAASLGAAIALNWNSIPELLQGTVGGIVAIIGGAALALGTVLAFTGAALPLGIALMVAGAAGLAAVVALNWNTIIDALQGPVGGITALVGGAVLALGAILAFTGVALPLGIALMVVGAASLATVATLNWNTITEALQGPVGGITALVGGAVLALGAVLAFTGVALPLGIALMVIGAASLATVATLNWSTITDALQGPVGGITALVGGALLALGAVLAFTGAGLPLGIALMVAGAASLGTVAALNWNTILDALEGPVGGIVALVGGALLAVGAILAFTGVGIPLGIGLMLAGAASLGTVAALNWDTITEAMRGPVGGIVALLSGALLVLGAILLFTGAGTGLGIGLMIAGAAGLGTTVAFNWNFLLDKLKEVWNGIKNFWNTKIKPIFTAEWWLNLAKKCGNGLIGGFEGAVNAIIGLFESMINWVVDGLNRISIDIPDWVPIWGGKTFGINIPRASLGRLSIPRLAEGGFPEEGQMFIAREAGPEMVGNIGRKTAVVNNEQIVASIAGGVAEANEEQTLLLREQNSLLRALLEKETGVYLDGKNLTDSVEKYQRERGRVLITGGVM